MLTPQTQAKKLAKALGLTTGLYLKREDLHPQGSHKGRSIPLMIEKYIKLGWDNFCISSSGNAAISAALTINEYNAKPSLVIPTTHSLRSVQAPEESLSGCIPRLGGVGVGEADECPIRSITSPTPGLEAYPAQAGNTDEDPSSATASLGMTKKLSLMIFVGKNIDSGKLKVIKKLLNKTVLLKKIDNPKQSAFQMEKSGDAKNLRQSTDDTALLGYASLAKELAKIKKLSAVFVPTSSGTTAQALHEEFEKKGLLPQIHIVQTPACHPMVKSTIPMNHSLATAIVDNVGFRKEAVQKGIRESGGHGWIATNKDISEAKILVKKTENINISSNSALSVAGLIQAIKNNRVFSGPVACILTGR